MKNTWKSFSNFFLFFLSVLFNPTFHMHFANWLNMEYAEKWLPKLIEQVPRYFHTRMDRTEISYYKFCFGLDNRKCIFGVDTANSSIFIFNKNPITKTQQRDTNIDELIEKWKKKEWNNSWRILILWWNFRVFPSNFSNLFSLQLELTNRKIKVNIDNYIVHTAVFNSYTLPSLSGAKQYCCFSDDTPMENIFLICLIKQFSHRSWRIQNNNRLLWLCDFELRRGTSLTHCTLNQKYNNNERKNASQINSR